MSEDNGRFSSPSEGAAELLREAVAQREARIGELRAEIDSIGPELQRYRKALTVLTAEPVQRKRRRAEREARGTSLSDEYLEQIERAVRELFVQQEEVTQTDARARLDMSTSVASSAFESLKQNKVIRTARKQGNFIYFRLTPAAHANNEAWLAEHAVTDG